MPVNNAVVKLYYKGEVGWRTEYFNSTCGTETLNKARAIARERKADHFDCGWRSEDDEYHVDEKARVPRLRGIASEADQIAAIQTSQKEREGSHGRQAKR